MADKPESLEETQRRLAAVSPYGPPAEAVRPDPYAPTAAPAPQPRRPTAVILAVAGAVAAAGVFGATIFFQNPSPSAVEQPVVDEWTTYPGTAHRTTEEVLAAESFEVISARGDAFLADFKQQLTDELGMTWTEILPRTVQADYNGYGGTSMLKYFHAGTWQGAAITDDPNARQLVRDIFDSLSLEYGAIDIYLANDFFEGAEAVTEFGAEELEDQALWSMWSDDPYTLGMNADALDVSLRGADDFVYDGLITVAPDDPNTFFVSVYAMAYALLSEADRDAYITALEAYEGLTKPDSR